MKDRGNGQWAMGTGEGGTERETEQAAGLDSRTKTPFPATGERAEAAGECMDRGWGEVWTGDGG